MISHIEAETGENWSAQKRRGRGEKERLAWSYVKKGRWSQVQAGKRHGKREEGRD